MKYPRTRGCLGVAYGIWAGLGIAIAAIIGVLIWGNPMNWVMMLGIALVIIGVVLLEMPRGNEATDGKGS